MHRDNNHVLGTVKDGIDRSAHDYQMEVFRHDPQFYPKALSCITVAAGQAALPNLRV